MKCLSIGGQAVMDGVMMMGAGRISVAVRKGDGTIDVKNDEKVSLSKKLGVEKIPIIRGLVNFFDSMVTGVKVLAYSGETSDADGEVLTTKDIAIAVASAILLVIGLFLVLPTVLTGFVRRFVEHPVLLSALEGIIKISIFTLYIWAITFVKYIKVFFQYHGAEHKTINCYEAGEELTVENVRKYTTRHRRCGTSFLLLVLIVSIIVSSLITWQNMLTRVALKIIILPLVAGFTYEIIRYAGRNDNLFVRIVSAPGIWMQRLTTREPDDAQIEVAIASVKGVLEHLEEKQ